MNFNLKDIQHNHSLLMEICKHLKKNYESFIDFSKNTFNTAEDWKIFCETKYMNKPVSAHFPLKITDSTIEQMSQQDDVQYMAKNIKVQIHRAHNTHSICRLINKPCVWDNLQIIDFSKSSVCITDDLIIPIYNST